MSRRAVKDLRKKIFGRLRTHPLEAVLAVTAPTAAITVASRLFGRWITDVALVLVAFVVLRPVASRVRACASARGRRCPPTEALLRVLGQILWCYIGACWDVLLLWFSDYRRGVARFNQRCGVAKWDPAPKVVNWRETTEGEEIVAEVWPGHGVDTAAALKFSVALEDAARCKDVRIARLGEARLLITFVYRDPLATLQLATPPVATLRPRTPEHLTAAKDDKDLHVADATKPIVIGKNAHGRHESVTVWKNNVLLGGMLDYGKSTLMANLIAGTVLDPRFVCHGVDPKRLELSIWRDVFSEVVFEPDEAHELVMDVLLPLCHQRTDELANANGGLGVGQHKPTVNDPGHVLFVDEFSMLDDATHKLLFKVMQLGRACSVSVVAATPRPSANQINSDTRALFGDRIAVKCRDYRESNIILGDGFNELGYDASTLKRQGEFLIVSNTSKALRCLGYNLQREQRHEIAARAATSRRSVPQSAPAVGAPLSAPFEQESSLGGAAGQSGADRPPPPDEWNAYATYYETAFGVRPAPPPLPSATPTAPVPPPPPTQDGPDFTGAEVQAKAYNVLLEAPAGLTHGEWMEAAKVSRDTISKVIAKCDGRWIRKDVDRYKAVTPAGDMAA